MIKVDLNQFIEGLERLKSHMERYESIVQLDPDTFGKWDREYGYVCAKITHLKRGDTTGLEAVHVPEVRRIANYWFNYKQDVNGQG